MDELKIKRLDKRAVIPQRSTPGSAGLDLCALLDRPLTLGGGGFALIGTGLAVEIPAGCAAFIFARSGLAVKHGIGLVNSVGVIDSDYRGEIKLGLINLGRESYTVQPGERVAQLVLMPVCAPRVHEAQELSGTGRGEGGFGSTGKK